MKKITLLLMTICLFQFSDGQVLAKEAVIDVSKKTSRSAAYNGYPSDVIVRDNDKEFELVYVTKAKKNEIKRNRLIFDYDLNLIEDISEVIATSDRFDREKVSVKSDADKLPANYKGEEFITNYLTLGGVVGGKVEKHEGKYTYNWTSRKYDFESKKIEDVKAKELVGKTIKNPQVTYFNNSESELLYVSGTGDKYNIVREYKINNIKADLTSDVVSTWSFNFVQRVFPVGRVIFEDGTENFIMIFANAGGKVWKPKIYQSPTVNEWTYMRFSSEGKVLNRATFQTKANNWQILGAYEKNGSVFIYGPGESKGVNEKHQDILAVIGTGKQDVFQILKVTGDNADFVSGPSLDEINDKLVTTVGGKKKKLEYDGKRVAFGNFNIAPNGDIFINAQDWKLDVTTTLPLYENLLMFHFDKNGTFKRLYGIESQKDNAGVAGRLDRNTDPRFYQDRGEIFSGSDGSMYWNTYTIKDISKYVTSWTSGNTEYTQTTWVPRLTGAIAKFDPEKGNMDAYKQLGNEQFMLYSIPSIGIPSISIEGGTQKIFIGYGSDKETKNQIWLGKLDPSTL